MENLNSLLSLSGKLLLNVKMNLDTKAEELKLKNIDLIQLNNELNTDEAKKTFWINIYNAYYQILANRLKLQRKNIFTQKEIIIAKSHFSLDDIEHGILRNCSLKWGFGYFPNPFCSLLIRNLTVQKIDFRIHFALNCGAKSCPPIAFYTLEKLDKQLDEATYSFILSETTIDMNNKTISTSKLLHWYRGDFGDTKGIKETLKKVLELDITTYKLCFNNYSWETHLENYA
ncbi:DUF547 domain-containing protein [Flavobacterium chilense]|uniref:DUF547 domain-containing protein n=1 Tax=Flavobacterium chilense TaxID=946677 RepID=A0A1M7MD56_9FLAO|nr:DUF547 domain-containing protein [Flavobacterium chilense]SHM88755.1 Protein of unknown function, DUF547 [Flavobacterium chilense]